MKKMTIVVSATGLMALSACMGDGESVTRGKYVGSESCPGASAISATYLQSVNGLPVRCGPQTQAPVTYSN